MAHGEFEAYPVLFIAGGRKRRDGNGHQCSRSIGSIGRPCSGLSVFREFVAVRGN